MLNGKRKETTLPTATASKSSIKSYPSKYPTKVPKSLSDSEWRKQRTVELYSYLPQTSLEDRYKYTDIRDEVIYLNYKFFGYVAAHVYIKGKHCSYEDKFQSALTAFCQMWHKYMYAAKYRTDLSFSVFFKPRLSECVYRDLLTVKHTINRSLKMEAAEQLGIQYSKLTYDDLTKVNMAPDRMASLKAVFYADFEEDLETASIFVPASADTTVYEQELYSDDYDDVEHVLIKEMLEKERLLTLSDLVELSDVLGIDVKQLEEAQPRAEKMLYDELQSIIECKKAFSDSI